MTRTEAEDLLFHEARLLDNRQLDSWLELFTQDGLYWIPIDDAAPVRSQTSLVYDTPERRVERVDHLLNNYFPSQSPRSRTVHVVSNVICEPVSKIDGKTETDAEADGEHATVYSSQVIYEMRTGDYTQSGIGELQTIVARVEHQLRRVDGALKIARKKILLMNRDTWQGNLTFLM
ncbi:aromatic-ring-hydroxylating dioxygenase subunit beta [Pararobbsia silviterrae]|nr:aromatic-ring-hydroxylating dioxygenase subunit beta [Pararobbsia silviterrae]